jgi:hypothetical protein
VNDTLFYARDIADIDPAIAGLCALSMELEEESDVAGLLGLHIEQKPDGSINLTQQGLIQCIIDAMDILKLPQKLKHARPGVVLGADNDD